METTQYDEIRDGHQGIVDAIRELSLKVDTLHEALIRLDDKVVAHIIEDKAFQEEMKPYMQGAAGIRVILKVFAVFASLAVGWLAFKTAFHIGTS